MHSTGYSYRISIRKETRRGCTDALHNAHRADEAFQRAALTCSSNRVMTAWTHSTGFCAAMAAHACTSAAADMMVKMMMMMKWRREDAFSRGLRPLRSSIHAALRAEQGRLGIRSGRCQKSSMPP